MKKVAFIICLFTGLGVFSGCKSKQKMRSNAESSEAMNLEAGNMKAYQIPEFEKLQPIVPKSELQIAIVKARQIKQVWKIPVVMRQAEMGGVADAYIGTSLSIDEEDRMKIKLNDSRLGVGLEDRLHSRWEDGYCKAWLVGQWGGDISPITSKPDEHTFTIITVLEDKVEEIVDANKNFVFVAK